MCMHTPYLSPHKLQKNYTTNKRNVNSVCIYGQRKFTLGKNQIQRTIKSVKQDINQKYAISILYYFLAPGKLPL